MFNFLNRERRKQQKEIRDKVAKINNRDLRMEDLYRQIYDGLYELGLDYAYIIEHMFTQNEQYVICTTGGKLYRINLEIDSDDKIILSEPITVEVQYIPIEEDEEERINKPTVFRSKSGELMFLSISCASVLNRIGTIDSRALFDSMEEDYKTRKNLGYLTYYHMGKAFQFGEVRGCFRYENFLITYGTIDESAVLGSVAERKLSEDGWGVSIGFLSTKEPVVQRFGDANIEVFTEGKLIEVSVLRENDAASYFTNIKNTRDKEDMGVTREQAKKLLLEFTGEGKEDQVDELLNEADMRQRSIEEEGLVTRSNEPENEEQEETEITAETETVLELDEEAVKAISEEIVKDLVSNEGVTEALRKIVEAEFAKFEERIKNLETTSSEVDVNRPTSRTSAVSVTFRPSKNENRTFEIEEETEEKPVRRSEQVDFKNLREKAREQREKTLIVKMGK